MKQHGDTTEPDRYLRAGQIVGVLVPVSLPTLWRWARAGSFPKPIKLSDRVTVWREADVRAWMAEQASKTERAGAVA